MPPACLGHLYLKDDFTSGVLEISICCHQVNSAWMVGVPGGESDN